MIISDLKDIAEQLNEASDKVNAVLLDAESQLKELNLGVEASTEDPIHFSYIDKDPDDDSTVQIKTHLGFHKLDGKWRLVARNYLASPGFERSYTSDERYDLKEIIPITSAPRSVRAAAVVCMNDLVIELKKEAEGLLHTVEGGSCLQV